MKYYSEKLDKMFDTEYALVEAEQNADKRITEKNLQAAKEKYDSECERASKVLSDAEDKTKEMIERAKKIYKEAADIYDNAADEAIAIYTMAKKEYDLATNKYDKENKKSTTEELFDEIFDFIRNW